MNDPDRPHPLDYYSSTAAATTNADRLIENFETVADGSRWEALLVGAVAIARCHQLEEHVATLERDIGRMLAAGTSETRRQERRVVTELYPRSGNVIALPRRGDAA